MPSRRQLAALAALASLFSSTPTRADSWHIAAAVEGRVSWLRRLPTLTVPMVENDLRHLPGGEVRPSSPPEGIFLVGGGLRVGVTVQNLLTVTLLGVEVEGAAGPGRAVASSLDGSLLELRPWEGGRFSLLGGGLGVRVTHRRFAFHARVDVGASLLWLGGAVSVGRDRVDVTPTAWSALARADLGFCLRRDATSRFCLAASVDLYEFGFLSGGALVLRREFGP